MFLYAVFASFFSTHGNHQFKYSKSSPEFNMNKAFTSLASLCLAPQVTPRRPRPRTGEEGEVGVTRRS